MMMDFKVALTPDYFSQSWSFQRDVDMTNHAAWREEVLCQNNMEMLDCLKSGIHFF